MKRVSALFLHVLAALAWAVAPSAQQSEADRASRFITAASIQKHQIYIASDELEGRDAGSEGGHKASRYIIEQISKLGLHPAGAGGDWYQPFGNGSFGSLEDGNYLRLAKDTTWSSYQVYKFKEHMIPLKESRCGLATGNVIFAGYGITAPDMEYDDYKGLNVKDALVLILDHEPQEKDSASKWTDEKKKKYSDWSLKIETAAKAGAAGLLIALDPENHPDAKGLPENPELKWPGDKDPKYPIPVVYVSVELSETLAKAAGKDLKAVQGEIDKTGKPRNFKLPRPAQLSVALKGPASVGTKNIVAEWPGTDAKLKSEYVVLGAHYDHVGMGREGSRGSPGKIHNGADDNASGTCTLLGVAAAIKQVKLKRSVLFIWFDGEEKGLLGSKAWCDSPTVPITSIVFMINMDMVGRNDIKKILVGVEKDEKKVPKYDKVMLELHDAERRFGVTFDFTGADDLIQRSDHWSFMQKQLPAVFFTGGLHGDYHTERDKVDKIDFQKEELIGKIVFHLACRCANSDRQLK